MNLYEHTIVTRQDTSPSQITQIIEKYSKIIDKNDGNIVKSENWGLLNLSYVIKKNKKGNYIHFKIEGNAKIIVELEKIESLDVNLLRYMTVKVKKFDLDTNYFGKSDQNDQYEQKKY
jgi:small subunit ribosomal protein S6